MTRAYKGNNPYADNQKKARSKKVNPSTTSIRLSDDILNRIDKWGVKNGKTNRHQTMVDLIKTALDDQDEFNVVRLGDD